MSDVPSVEVEQLRDMLRSNEPPFVLDVREKRENEICNLPGHHLVPLADLPGHIGDLPRDKTIVVHCHHGGRSARATAYLMQQGFKNVFNLKGGIHAWSERIDSTVKTYT
ncbi:MAG: rhodanese-like domain-containing protein [Pseudomonadota bacterium]|nr:rhodanese-like domain-containing protein [Pseudomonadota bacterium]